MRLRKEIRKFSGKIWLKSRGFTLMEIVVSFSIIALLTAILMANYHSTNQRSQLNIIRQQIISDIRLAQNYSLGSKLYNGVIPPGGWGLYFRSQPPNNNFYILFADTIVNSNNYHRYNDGEANQAYGGKTVNLPSGITISYLKVNNVNVNRTSLEITYEPPDPTVWICRPGQCNGNRAVITLDDGNGQTRTITLNSFGLVDPN